MVDIDDLRLKFSSIELTGSRDENLLKCVKDWHTENAIDPAVLFTLVHNTATKDHRYACLQGFFYHYGIGVEEPSLEHAFYWYRISAEEGDAFGQNQFGWCCRYGLGGEEDLVASFHWYSKAAAKGNLSACCNLACSYYIGVGTKVDFRKAWWYWLKSARKGLNVGQYCVADCYRLGDGIEKDLHEAIRWFRLAKGNGYQGSYNMLWSIFEFEEA